MNKDLLIHMMVLDRTMFATEMKDKAYVQDLDTLSVYVQGDLVPLVFAAEEMLAELDFQNHFVHAALECQ
jgi:hypothetical protein